MNGMRAKCRCTTPVSRSSSEGVQSQLGCSEGARKCPTPRAASSTCHELGPQARARSPRGRLPGMTRDECSLVGPLKGVSESAPPAPCNPRRRPRVKVPACSRLRPSAAQSGMRPTPASLPAPPRAPHFSRARGADRHRAPARKPDLGRSRMAMPLSPF